jgi:endonuclease YncB( thermonuclease family)
MNIQPAWDLIGHEGSFRVLGGRTIYEAVLRNEATARSDGLVRLSYLNTRDGYLRQVNRWVDGDTPIEVLVDHDADA